MKLNEGPTSVNLYTLFFHLTCNYVTSSLYFTGNESCKSLEDGIRNKRLAANTKPSPLNETEERPEEKQIDNCNKDIEAGHNTQEEADTMPCTETTNVHVFTGEWDINKFVF